MPALAATFQAEVPGEIRRAASAPEAAPSAYASYAAEEFSRFSPRTALDTLEQVPGFTIEREAHGRGLGGASGNIVIDGRRISGKSNDVVTELRRIPAGNVVGTYIVEATSIDAPGFSARIANVIVRSGGFRGQLEWRPEYRNRSAGPLLPDGEVSASGAVGRLAYVLGLRNVADHEGAAGMTKIFDPTGHLVEERREQVTPSAHRLRVSGRFTYNDGAASVANLNISYGRSWLRTRGRSERSGPGLPDHLRQTTSSENGRSYGIGGDFQFPLIGGQLKLVALHQREHSPVLATTITTFSDLRPGVGERVDRVSDENESINRLDRIARIFTLASGGVFEEVPLAGGTATIAEDRLKLMVDHSRSLGPRLALQLSIGGECSKLRQSAPLGLTRTFYRPKGFLSAAWELSPRARVSAKVERRVGQLSFGDMLASATLSNGTPNRSNPDLVPPQSWDAEATATLDLGSWGQTALRGYGRLTSDVIDQIPLGEAGEGPGNAGRALLYGIAANSTINFDPIGWRGAKLNINIQLQKSSVKDPLTGQPRAVSGELVRLLDLALRHDVAGTCWAWGGSIQHSRDSRSFRLSAHSRSYEGPVLGLVFIENKDVFGLTVRGSFANLLGADDIMNRVVFSGDRDGPVAFRLFRKREIGPIFSLSVTGAI